MDFAKLHRHCQTALLLSLAAALSLSASRAQDSANEGGVPRTDRPEISVSVHDHAGGTIAAAGTVKLYRDGILNGSASLVRGRAFFGSIPNGSYTVEVDATGYKPTQRDVNITVSMRYEVDVTLQREGATDSGAPGKPLLAPKAKEALDKSLKALSKNKLSEAEKYVAEAVQLAPSHPDVLYVQGVVFLNEKNWVQAQSVLEKASQMDPTNGRTLSALGMAFLDQGNYDAAVAPLEKSLQLEPVSWETHYVLGQAYYHRQKYDQALATSQLALTESKGKAPEIELLVAQALTAVGKYEDAAQVLRDFLKRYGDRPEAPTARRWLEGLAKNGKIRSN
ncbi:MAG: tetratricopeptide repeat protein [Acidobacteriia bacterium]|nr:tetratricopeptide repeat protein [Terriglobia bacterium]